MTINKLDLLTPIQQGMAARSTMQQNRMQREQYERQKDLDEQFRAFANSPNPMIDPNLKRLAAEDPKRVQAIMQAAQAPDAWRLNQMLEDAKDLKYLARTGRESAIVPFLQQRIADVKAAGGNPMHSIGALEAYQAGGMEGLNREVAAFESVFDPNYKEQGRKQNVGEKIANYEYYEKLRRSNPEAAARFAQSANLNPQERAGLSVETDRLKREEKEQINRLTGFASSGVSAADNLSDVKRTIELLDSVKTGGFDNAAFNAKRLFGIEAADEGELSYLMSKSVLSQLKSIFGSAFTAGEGERLEKIEASFSRNPETNKRLLQRIYKSTERAAKRGIRAAKDIGDDFTANEIQLVLDRVIGGEDDEPNQQQQMQVQPQATGTVNWADLP